MSTLRSQFDAVHDSIINGQRTQAYSQMKEIGMYDLPEMLEYFAEDLGNPELAIDAARTYFRLASR